ncbi:hypothetical protein CMO90_02880, partial [Candidatus Woesearchaeota archaeon]|nr:hypothetical protein [Candidatus Woesearchaeota archaeon]
MRKEFFIVFLLMIQSVLAVNVDIEFLSHGAPISTVSNSRVPNIDLRLTVTGEFSSLVADISGLHKNTVYAQTFGYQNRIVQADNCQEVGDTYTCYIRMVELMLPSASVIIPMTVTTDAGEEFVETTYTFSMDDTSPTATSIKTDTCIEDVCYIASDEYTDIELKFDDGPFEKRLVKYSLGGDTHIVQDCTGLTCVGRAKKTCNSGQKVVLKILKHQSMDDAYNKVKNSLSNELVCDGDAPSVDTDNIEVTSDSRYGEIKEGDTLFIKVLVDEENEGLTATINTSSLNGGEVSSAECDKNIDGLYECLFRVSGILPAVSEPEMIFKDIVGNKASVTTSISIYPILRDRTPNCFSVTEQELRPSSIDRIMLDLALEAGIRYPVFGEYSISSDRCSDALVLQQDIESCVYKQNNNISTTSFVFSEIKIADKKAGEGDNRIDFVFSRAADVNDFGGSFEVICNLSLRIADNNGYYDLPEKETVTFNFGMRNSKLGTPGEAFVDKIKKWEESGLVDQNYIGLANTVLSTMHDICSVSVFLDYAEGLSVATEVAGVVIEKVSGFAGVKIAGKKSFDVTNKAEKKLKGDIPLGLLGKTCTWTSCPLDEAKFFDETSFEWVNKMNTISDTVSDAVSGNEFAQAINFDSVVQDIKAPNVETSIIAAAYRGCLPALIAHLNRLRENQCEVLTCLKANSEYGIDVYGCEEAQSAYHCKMFVSEALEIPGIRAVKNIADNFDSYVNLLIPNVLMGVLDKFICNNGVLAVDSPDWKIGVCHIPDSLGRFLLQDSLTSGSKNYAYTPSPDVCTAALCTGGVEECRIKSSSLIGAKYGDIPSPTDEEIVGFEKSIREFRRESVSTPDLYKAIRKGQTFFREINVYLEDTNTNAPKLDDESVILTDDQLHALKTYDSQLYNGYKDSVSLVEDVIEKVAARDDLTKSVSEAKSFVTTTEEKFNNEMEKTTKALEEKLAQRQEAKDETDLLELDAETYTLMLENMNYVSNFNDFVEKNYENYDPPPLYDDGEPVDELKTMLDENEAYIEAKEKLAEAKEKLAEAEEATETEAEKAVKTAKANLEKAKKPVIDDFTKKKFAESQKDYEFVQKTKKTLEDQNIDVEEIDEKGEESEDFKKIEKRRTIAIKKAKEERINAGVDIASRFFYEYV